VERSTKSFVNRQPHRLHHRPPAPNLPSRVAPPIGQAPSRPRLPRQCPQDVRHAPFVRVAPAFRRRITATSVFFFSTATSYVQTLIGFPATATANPKRSPPYTQPRLYSASRTPRRCGKSYFRGALDERSSGRRNAKKAHAGRFRRSRAKIIQGAPPSHQEKAIASEFRAPAKIGNNVVRSVPGGAPGQAKKPPYEFDTRSGRSTLTPRRCSAHRGAKSSPPIPKPSRTGLPYPPQGPKAFGKPGQEQRRRCAIQ